jgi:hypothetical protein
LLYSSFEAILALILLFIQLDLQKANNLVEFKRNIELLVEYQEIKLSKISKFIKNLGNNLESLNNKDVLAKLTALQKRTIKKKTNKQ